MSTIAVLPGIESLNPLYEENPNSLLGQHLVMTPWMLMDRLCECQEMLRDLQACVLDEIENQGDDSRRRRRACQTTRLHELQAQIEHTLHVLERGGLWLESTPECRVAADGKHYSVVRAPFTTHFKFLKELSAPKSQPEAYPADNSLNTPPETTR